MKKYLKSIIITGIAAIMCLFICKPVRAAEIPSIPEGVKQVKASSHSVNISWSTVIATDVRYDVQYASSPDGPWAYDGGEHYYRSGTSVSITGLSPGQRYYVRVRAWVKEGSDYYDGDWSAPIDAVTEYSENNTKSIQTDGTVNTITLQWTDVGADGYNVEYNKIGDAAVIISTKSASIQLTGLLAGSAYKYRVLPYLESSTYKAEMSSYVSLKTAKTLTEKPICILPNTWWNIGSLRVAPNNYGNSSADGFEYQIQDNKNKNIVSGNYTGYSSVDLSNPKFKKTQFNRFRVRNYITLGNGTRKYTDWSDWIYASKYPAIDKIRKGSGTSLKLSWQKVKGATNYTVYISTKQKTGYKKAATTKKTSYTVKKYGKKALKSKKRYYFYVVANKKAGKKTYKTDFGQYWYLNKY